MRRKGNPVQGGEVQGAPLRLPSAQHPPGGKGSHSAAADIRDQGHAGGDQRKMGKEEADREVALVPVPAQPAGAAGLTSVG